MKPLRIRTFLSYLQKIRKFTFKHIEITFGHIKTQAGTCFDTSETSTALIRCIG